MANNNDFFNLVINRLVQLNILTVNYKETM
jgi:hypothetical protein